MVGSGILFNNAVKVFSLGNGGKVAALDNINLSVPAGDFLVIMGPNGAGKTTLLRVIEGSVTLDSGSVKVLSNESAGTTAGDSTEVVHISQDPLSRTFGKLSLAENFLLSEIRNHRIGFLRRGITRKRKKIYIDFLEKYDQNELIPYLERPLTELSGGQRQIASLLIAFLPLSAINESIKGVILLDEPTASLDVENERRWLEIVNFIHQVGATVIFVTHNPAVAVKMGNRLLFMQQGRIARDLGGEEKACLSSYQIAKIISEMAVFGPLENISVKSG